MIQQISKTNSSNVKDVGLYWSLAVSEKFIFV